MGSRRGQASDVETIDNLGAIKFIYRDEEMTLLNQIVMKCRSLTLFTALFIAGCAGGNARAPASQAGDVGVAPGNRTFFVNCSRSVNGTGVQQAPFNNLASANALTLKAGDRLLFKRGTSCAGGLVPNGSGKAGRPILIGAYGSGPVPAIHALAVNPAAVTLTDMSNVVIEDLTLTNSTGSPSGIRRGLLVSATSGVVTNVIARRLEVKNVVATSANQESNAGGIVFAASPGARFDGITIQDNKVADLANGGINVSGGGVNRPRADQPWPSASTRVLVTGNTVQRVAGNGILVKGANAPISSHNVVIQAGLANRDFRDPVNRVCNVGLWFFNTNNALAEYNEVSHTVHKGPSARDTGCDGEAFDIDYNQDNTTYQYNYSHNNGGGFMLICTDGPRTGTIRYNLSVDDSAVFGAAPCEQIIDPEKSNLTGVTMHNNTFVSSNPQFLSQDSADQARKVLPFFGDFEFKNNIIYATSPVPAQSFFFCGTNCSNNLFFNMPAYGKNAISGDPRFINSKARGTGLGIAKAFRLQSSSIARCKGAAVTPTALPARANQDFFGNAIPSVLSIGFHQPPC